MVPQGQVKLRLYLFLGLWPVAKGGGGEKCRRPKNRIQFTIVQGIPMVSPQTVHSAVNIDIYDVVIDSA